MRAPTLALLRCPFCVSRLALGTVMEEDEAGVLFGIVICSECRSEFPIAGGVLLTAIPSDRLDSGVARRQPRGPARLRALCALIRAGNQTEALSQLLNPCTDTANLLVRPALRAHRYRPDGGVPGAQMKVVMDVPHPSRRMLLPSSVQRRMDRITGGRLLRSSRRRVSRFLLRHLRDLSAWEAIGLYYAGFSRSAMASYFAFRFCRPRHLAALSLASVVRSRGGPVLDLACGAGHLTHYLSSGPDAPTVVGVDRHFFSLFIARNFLAPQAAFVCQAADLPLPLARGFDAAFCSDAFYYLTHKALCIREMRRVIRSHGVIVIPGLGDMTPDQGGRVRLTPPGYHRLFGSLNHVFVSEISLMRSYLCKSGPDLRRGEAEHARRRRWWCAVASADGEVFRQFPPFPEWPHRAGRLVVNPIYRSVSSSTDSIELRRQVPADWFDYEQDLFLDHTPEVIEMPIAALDRLVKGVDVEENEDLVSRFVLIGVPERYLPL